MILENRLYVYQMPKPERLPDGKYMNYLTPEQKATRAKRVDDLTALHADWVANHSEEVGHCTVDGCNHVHKAGGLCKKHYYHLASKRRWARKKAERERVKNR